MVQFAVGDVVTLCASIRDWCSYNNYYEIFDINISASTCAINYTNFGCLSPSGVQLDFQWTNTRSNTPTHGCDSANNLKLLGSATTNSQGIASFTYTITQDDLNLFNTNTIFDLRVCIRGTPYVLPLMIGKTRNEISYHNGDYITIVQDRCAGILCPDRCFGNDLYSQICDPATGLCTQGTIISPSPNPACLSIGSISFDSDPQGARIWLAQSLQIPIDMGVQTPNTISSLPEGTYDYILKRFNYQDYTGTINVLTNQTSIVSALMIPIPGSVYQLKMKLGNETTGTYVSNTINKFADTLNSIILSKFNIMLSSVIYDTINHDIIIEIEDMPVLNMEYLNIMHNSPQIKSLILPAIIPIIIELVPYVAILLGWAIAYFIYAGPKVVTPTQSNLQITTTILVNELQAIPIKDVIVEVAGQRLTANAGNGYIVTFSNLGIGKTYPVKAYIPLSAGSSVYEASFYGNKTIVDVPLNTMVTPLKIDTLQERDWQICNLTLDGSPMPIGTIIRVYRMKTSANGTPIPDTLGTTISGANYCSGIVKVPAYLLDSQILTQFISNSIDPTAPSPTLLPGDQTNASTVNGEKNTITVTTETILKNNIVADRIDIKNKSTGIIIKSVVPTVNTTSISGIPSGTYEVIAIKSGYKITACNISLCEVTFTSEYLGSENVTVILESLVKTCNLTITVIDVYNKPPKTQTSIAIDGAAAQIAPNGILDIPEITSGTHKFTIKADGYKDIIDEYRSIACTTSADAITFTLQQTTDIVVGSMDLTIDIPEESRLDLKGSIQIKKNQVFKVKVAGGNGADPIEIYNISEVPDLLIATLPPGTGLTGTTLSYDKDMTLELQAFQRCIAGICAESSNVVSITVGTGSPKCAIPSPFGGCLIEQTTGFGFMILAGLGLVAAMTIFGKGGGGTKIIERIPPHYTPPEIQKQRSKE